MQVQGDGRINPAILYAAKLCGITTLIESGGAGAIAAMAYGTELVPKVNKIFGPGNSFVTMAKQPPHLDYDRFPLCAAWLDLR